ncbi:MAG TPA: N,N-dimethylformamidase beta subunit family domain-containing protein [Baekduia sp.]|nr:N,N-dimethylformamidase beta subunit family domain-containing protein [Baekduia sp.]
MTAAAPAGMRGERAPGAPPRGDRPARIAVVAFAVLVLATFAAFFVAQRVKRAPSVLEDLQIGTGVPGRLFSPNGDGRHDRARIAFAVKRSDHVTVSVLADGGDAVRTLVDDRRVAAHRPVAPHGIAWDGRDDDGRLVPDGRYRLRIVLRDQGRSVVPLRTIVKDTRPPQPRVTAIGPQRPRLPELLPEPGGAVVHLTPALAGGRMHVFRTAPGQPREVRTDPLPAGATTWRWSGRDGDGRRVLPGTYLVVPEWRDAAGNVGTGVPLGRDGLPVLGHGPLPGRGGVTVRYLAVQAPVAPARPRRRVQLAVDARRKPYRWSVRRIGTREALVHSHRAKTSALVSFEAPRGDSGVYLFEARSGGHRATVPFAVQKRVGVGGTAADPRGVLVVLPAITWQGRNAVDDDGDGAPNTLDLGGPAKLLRVASGLPAGFTEHEAPALLWLDSTHRAYDVTTDAALAAGNGPKLAGHRGVLIPGDARWLPAGVRAELRTFVRRGGTLVSLGTDSLRRTVRLDGDRLSDPSPPRRADLFGMRLGPLQHRATNLEVFQDDPAVELFSGGSGLFADVPAWEPTEQAGTEADLLSRAVTQQPAGTNVVVAARFGKGLVIRPGFPAFAQRLSPSANDPAVSALMARMWTLLSR